MSLSPNPTPHALRNVPAHMPAPAFKTSMVRTNHLLNALPVDVLERLLPKLEPVNMTLGSALYESGSVRSHAYFPTTAVVSMMYVTENGGCSEMASAGREGMVGSCLFMGANTTSDRAVVNTAGLGYRLSQYAMAAEFSREEDFFRLMLRYVQAQMTSITQTAVCNRHHSVSSQLATWLMRQLDRLNGDEIVMTHELLASILGVRREGITEAACKLQALGIIRYARGHITVLDREALRAHCCECYEVVRRERERLLPQ